MSRNSADLGLFYGDVHLITQELRYEKTASKESTLNCIGRCIC